MAVLNLHKGINVTINSNGSPLPEYPDPESAALPIPATLSKSAAVHQGLRTVSTYIPSTTGAPFSIHMPVAPPYKIDCSKLHFDIRVDGKKVWTSTCGRPWLEKNGGRWEDEVRGVKEGKGRGCTVRDFKFVGIGTTSEEDRSQSAAAKEREVECMKKIGRVEVWVFRGRYGKKGGDTEGSSKGFLKRDTEVHEKTIKGEAKSHGAALGTAYNVPRGDVWRPDLLDGEEYPIAIFRFIYRSESALKQLLIIPRTPTPTPSPSPSPSPSRSPSPVRDADGFTAEERERIEEEIRQRAEEVRERVRGEAAAAREGSRGGESRRRRELRIKRERMEDGGEGGRKRRRGNARGRGPMVEIDLTGESDGENGGESEDEEGLFARI